MCDMKKIIYKLKRIIKIFGAIIYLFYCRIKYRNKKRGIAQVVESFNSGGLEQVATNIYKTFYSNENVSCVISLSNNLGPMCQQLESPAHLRIIYYDVAEMIKFCAKNNIYTLVYHFTTFHMILFKILGFRNYYIIHNTYIWYTDKEWRNLKIKLKFSTGIIAVSEWCKSYFVNKTSITNVKVILNGIDIKNITSGDISSITRESLKIKNNDIVCLTIGSYTPGKHQLALIGIAEKIIKVNKNIKFVCAGPILDKELYELFLKEVKRSSASKNIIPLTYIPQNEIGDFINKICDIYLQPSIHEAGVPLTVMEALLMGKPVVMTDFMLEKTFKKVDRIYGVKPPYKNILDVTPQKANKLSRKIIDDSTSEFVDAILKIADNLEDLKSTFDISEYEFLSLEVMAKEYLDFIKI